MFKPYAKKVEKDPESIFCTWCGFSFKLSGLYGAKGHVSRTLHKKKEAEYKSAKKDNDKKL